MKDQGSRQGRRPKGHGGHFGHVKLGGGRSKGHCVVLGNFAGDL